MEPPKALLSEFRPSGPWAVGWEGRWEGPLSGHLSSPLSPGVQFFSQRLPGTPRPGSHVRAPWLRHHEAASPQGCVTTRSKEVEQGDTEGRVAWYLPFPRGADPRRQEIHKSSWSLALASLFRPHGWACGVGAGTWGRGAVSLDKWYSAFLKKWPQIPFCCMMTLRMSSVQTKSESGQQDKGQGRECWLQEKPDLCCFETGMDYAWPPLVSGRTVAMTTALGKEVKRWELGLLRLGVGERNISGPVLLLFIKRKWGSRR